MFFHTLQNRNPAADGKPQKHTYVIEDFLYAHVRKTLLYLVWYAHGTYTCGAGFQLINI